MAPERTGSLLIRGSKIYARVRLSPTHRPPLRLAACKTEEEGRKRLEEIQTAINSLNEAGKGGTTENFARQLAAAGQPELRKTILRVISQSLKGDRSDRVSIQSGLSVEDFAKQWTEGKLHERWPHHVSAKKVSSVKRDAGVFKTYVNPEIGPLPIAAIDLGHIEAVMARVPAKRSPATRRHVAQVLHRLLGYAVYPAKLIAANPMPEGFLPKLPKPRATGHLYPDEDSSLMAMTAVPVVRRLLWGVLHREGMRADEAVGLEWTDLDLDKGAIRLDQNKTDDPRMWALDPGTWRALVVWKKRGYHARLVFGKKPISGRGADDYRADIANAGISRPELTVTSRERRQVRMHDTRTAFVTIALADGKSETWVMDRTGHKTSTMVQKYRRGARLAAELKLGYWAPLDAAVPDLSSGSSRDLCVAEGSESSRGTAENKPIGTFSVPDQHIQNPPTKSRVGSSPTFGTHSGNPASEALAISGLVPAPVPEAPWPYSPGRIFLVAGALGVIPVRMHPRVVGRS